MSEQDKQYEYEEDCAIANITIDCAATVSTLVQYLNERNVTESESETINLRELPRGKKRTVDHHRALECINSDYLGPTPLFNGREFQSMFRISRTRLGLISQALTAHHPFWENSRLDAFGKNGPSTQSKILLPLKCLAFGVPTHTFRDYFQLSSTMATACFYQFVEDMQKVYGDTYLALPTASQLKSIVNLHKVQHGVPGMVGSLDCMHCKWIKCPKVYHGAFKGSHDSPTVVLEAACDYNLYFWHPAFGFPGTFNDLNIWNLSPLLTAFLNGDMEAIEKELLPYKIAGIDFDVLFFC